MPALLDHRLVVVTGKGGVGKSTISAALAVAAVRAGRTVIVAEVARRADVAHEVRAAGADHLSIDPQEALEAYLMQQLPSRSLAELLGGSRMFQYFAAATPGMRELLTIGQVWDLAQDERRTRQDRHDLVILDAPATGHALGMLSAPRTFSEAVRVGPVARQGATIHAMLCDPEQTAVVVAATPEETPITETLYLRDHLLDELGLPVSLFVVNRVRSNGVTGQDAEVLARSSHPAAALALAARRQAVAQRAQIARLRRGARGVPVATLPFGTAPPDLAAFAGRLGRSA